MPDVEDNLSNVIEGFRENRESVLALMTFDKAVLDLVVTQLESLRDRTRTAWSKKLGMKDVKLNPYLEVEKTIQFVRGIRDHESLRPRYEAMVNQALVLLVSYFGSAVRDLFRFAVRRSVAGGRNEQLLSTSVRTTVSDITEMDDPASFVAEWLADRSDLSFQDMRSIGRALNKYFNVRITRTERENEIIVGQACRHAIVHAGGRVDDQLVRQAAAASPRTVKRRLRRGEDLQFTAEEVRTIGDSMESYLVDVSVQLERRLAENVETS